MHQAVAGRLTGRVTKWFVLAFWIIAVAGLGTFAGKLSGQLDNQASSWLPGSAESTKALDQLKAFQDPNSIPTVVVYERTGGLTGSDLSTMRSQVAQFAQLAKVTGRPIGPIPSADGQAAQTIVTFNAGKNGWNEMPGIVKDLRAHAAIPGVSVHIAGPGGQAADNAQAFSGIDGTLLYATIAVVVIILLLTYRSPVLWILPVLSAGVALTIAQAVVYFGSKELGLVVNGQSQGILTVLVFGAGTDYALLLIARYREELRRHEDRHEAMALALHRAGPAIIASALTVVLGMLCLLLAEMNSTRGLGPVAAAGIVVGLLVMTTLLPALLVITGRWIFWPARPAYGSPEPTASGLWARLGARIARAPRLVWVGTSILLAVAAIGILQLNPHGLSTQDSYTKTFDSVVGQQVLTRHHLNDNASPAMILTTPGRADAVRQAASGVPGIGPMSPPVTRNGTTLLTVPIAGDAMTPAAQRTVQHLRDAVHRADAGALVGGGPAIQLDVEHASTRDTWVIIPVVLVVVVLILMGLLRAVLAPVLLVGTVVLSFGAALGLSSLVFRHVLGFAGADAGLPLFVFVFLVALGIDYNIFLMTRVREETQTRGTRTGALIALSSTGGVITSAGLVLAATFLVLTTLPMVAFAEIGVAVALGVVLDTMVVRSILVTALNLDFGHRIWWPSRLDRRHTPEPEPAPALLD